MGEEAGGEGGRGRASVHGISAGWRERGVWSQPGRLFPQPRAERAAMALARPGTLAPRPPAPLLLQLLLLSPALALLGGELGHKPWGVGGWGSVSQSRHARPRGSLCGCQDGLQGWAQAKMWVQRGALLPELAWKRVRPGTWGLLCGVGGGAL